MTPLISLAFILAIFGIGTVFGYTILEPLANAIRGAKASSRFYIGDFFPLSFWVAIPILFVTNMRRMHGANSSVVNLAGLILIGVFVYAWGRGATALSSAGVVDTRKRCLLLGVLLPVAIVGSAVIVPALLMMSFALFERTRLDHFIWLVEILAVPIVALLCRRCTIWVLSHNDASLCKRDQMTMP